MAYASRGHRSSVNMSSAQAKFEKRARLEESDLAANNQTFLKEQVMEFYDLFELYSNRQTDKVDFKDILATAKTLGLDDKYKMVFKVLTEIEESNQNEARQQNISDSVDFQTFIALLQQKLGGVSDDEGREAIFRLLGSGQEQIDLNRLLEVAEDLRYTLTEEEAKEIIHNVAGYSQTQFDFEQFNKFVEKKILKRKQDQLS